MCLTRLRWTGVLQRKQRRKSFHPNISFFWNRNLPWVGWVEVAKLSCLPCNLLNMVLNRSGQLNAKQRELMELQTLAQRRLKGVRAGFAEGVRNARDTKADLEYTQKRVE